MKTDTSTLSTKIFALLLSVLAAPGALAQQVTYDVAFPNIEHHEAEITATFADVPTDTPAVRMSRTSPGRYALHEFAKNVYDVRVTDGDGHDLDVERPNLHEWDVPARNGTVRVAYTVYGDQADGTYAAFDPTHVHMNMPAVFMWARGMTDAPIRVTFHRPDPDWRFATQLFETDDAETFTAPDLAYFMDSPTEISDFDERTWTVTANGDTYPIHLDVHHRGTREELDEYANMAKKVVAEHVAVYGETPDYDNGSYTFIADYLPYVDGDGMEHRNSTILTSTRPLSTSAMDNLGTLSHEFAHQWNVERIRPEGLKPFDFENANVSGALWFAEGFTNYYDGLLIRRAGLMDDAGFAEDMARPLSYVINAPGRQFYAPVGMSRQAPFVDAAVSIDPQNKRNTFISYYTWGSVIGLGLDLTLRSRYDLTLDDYMRAMWRQYGKPEEAYSVADLQRVLGDLTGDRSFARNFFDDYVRGSELMDYERLLAKAGLLLRKAHPADAWLGARLRDGGDGHAVIAGNTLIGSPIYAAGLDRGDVIERVDGEAVESAVDVRDVLADHAPGDAVEIDYRQRGRAGTTSVTLAQNPRMEIVTYEDAGRRVSEAMQDFRAGWLETHAEPGE